MLAIKQETVVIGVVVGLVVVALVVFLAAYATEGDHPSFETAHVINLDKDAKKLTSCLSRLPPSIKAERWTATYGKDVDPYSFRWLGVGTVIVMSGKGTYKQQWKDLRNLGAVGCFLSHRALLQHLATLPVPDSTGHLVIEDDVLFEPEFEASWESLRRRIPKDWDMVYLGIHGPRGDVVSPGIFRLRKANDGNTGTHAYIVRHGALRTKLLPKLKYMMDAIDQQYTEHFDTVNAYGFQTQLAKQDDALESTIQKM